MTHKQKLKKIVIPNEQERNAIYDSCTKTNDGRCCGCYESTGIFSEIQHLTTIQQLQELYQ